MSQSPSSRGTSPWTPILLAAWIWCAAVAAASADPAPPVDVGEVTTLDLLPHDPNSPAIPSIHILDEHDGKLLLEFELPALSSQAVTIDGEVYHGLEIPGGGFAGAIGEPMLPTYSRLLAMPDRAAANLAVVGQEKMELAGYRPLPVQPAGAGDFVIQAEAYAHGEYGGQPVATLGEPALARDLRVVPVTIQPVRFDAARQTIEVTTRIQIEVDFTGDDLRNVPRRHASTLPPSFDRLYRDLVINYSGPRQGQTLLPGAYVLIAPDSPAVLTALEPLVEWRTRQGFDVHLVTTT